MDRSSPSRTPARAERRPFSIATSSSETRAGSSGARRCSGAFESGDIVDSSSPDWFEETPTRLRAVPIVREHSKDGRSAARDRRGHSGTRNLGETSIPSRQQITFDECANDLFRMISSSEFPDLGRAHLASSRGPARLGRADPHRCRRDQHVRESQRAVGFQQDGVRRRARGRVARRGDHRHPPCHAAGR